jgi:hypothetical protein
MPQALEAARAHSPAAVARSLASACCRVLNEADGGLDGPAFACLQYLFLFAGQAAPRILANFPAGLNDCIVGDDGTSLRESLLHSLWSLAEAFIRARTRLRNPEFDRQHGPAALEAAAARFFPFLAAVWPWVQVSTASDTIAINLEIYGLVFVFKSCSIVLGFSIFSLIATHAAS